MLCLHWICTCDASRIGISSVFWREECRWPGQRQLNYIDARVQNLMEDVRCYTRRFEREREGEEVFRSPEVYRLSSALFFLKGFTPGLASSSLFFLALLFPLEPGGGETNENDPGAPFDIG